MLYHGPTAVVHVPAGQTVQVMEFLVPAGQIWRPQLFTLERTSGTGTVVVVAHVHPAGASQTFLVDRVEFAGGSLQRAPRTGAWGPGDYVVLSATAPGTAVDLKILAAVLIDEGVTRYAPTPPPVPPPTPWGPHIDTVTPSTVPKGPTQTFTLRGAGFDLVQQGLNCTIRRPNATTVGRPGTYVSATEITLTYANIDLVGNYAVWVHSGAVKSNEVTFSAS